MEPSKNMINVSSLYEDEAVSRIRLPDSPPLGMQAAAGGGEVIIFFSLIVNLENRRVFSLYDHD